MTAGEQKMVVLWLRSHKENVHPIAPLICILWEFIHIIMQGGIKSGQRKAQRKIHSVQTSPALLPTQSDKTLTWFSVVE